MPIGVAKSGKRRSSPRVGRVTIHCKICGASKMMLPSQARQRSGEFCSRSCYNEYKRQSAPPRKRGNMMVVCDGCGISFVAFPSRLSGKRIYCSRVCYHSNNKSQFNYKAWHAANRTKRRDAKRGVMTATLKQIGKMFAFANGRCVYCGRPSEELEMDHITPIVAGGTGEIENILAACRSCNASKGASDVTEWLVNKFGVLGLARAITFLERTPAHWALHGVDIMETSA